MKKILILWTFLACLHFSGLQASGQDEVFSVGIAADLVSTYYWRGYDITDGEPAIQPTMTVAHNPTGLFFNLWTSHALNNRSELGETDEYDFTLGWDRALGSHAGFSVGTIAYVYPRLSREEDLSRELFVGFYLVDVPFSPSITYYHDVDLGDGGYLEVGGSHSIGSLDLSATAGFSAEQYTSHRGLADVVLRASYSIPIGEEGLISPFLSVAAVNDEERNPDDAVFWFGVTFGWEH